MGALFSRARPSPRPVSPKGANLCDVPGAIVQRQATSSSVSSEMAQAAEDAEMRGSEILVTGSSEEVVSSSPRQVHLEQQSTPRPAPPPAQSAPTSPNSPAEIDLRRSLDGWALPALYTSAEEVTSLFRFGACVGRGLDSIVFKAASLQEQHAKPAAAPE